MPINLSGDTGITTPGVASTAMPTSGGDPVVESGSNTDGEWTRFADGTQVCSKDSSGGSTRAFPLPFIAAPRIALADSRGGQSNQWGCVSVSSHDATQLVTATLYTANGGSSWDTSSQPGHYTATGRWK